MIGDVWSYDREFCSSSSSSSSSCLTSITKKPKEMKSTKVQTLGELRMRGTANWWAGLLVCVYSWSPASSSQRVWHGLATVVDSMRESIHALRCGFLCLQGTQSKWLCTICLLSFVQISSRWNIVKWTVLAKDPNFKSLLWRVLRTQTQIIRSRSFLLVHSPCWTVYYDGCQ